MHIPVTCMSEQSYMLQHNKASNTTNIILPIGSTLVLFGKESLNHRLASSDKPDLQRWNWSICSLPSPHRWAPALLSSGIHLLHAGDGGEPHPAEQTGLWELGGKQQPEHEDDLRHQAQDVWRWVQIHKRIFLPALFWLTPALEWHLLTRLNKLPFLLLSTHGNRPDAPLIDRASIPRRVKSVVRLNLLACRTNKTALMRLRDGVSWHSWTHSCL